LYRSHTTKELCQPFPFQFFLWPQFFKTLINEDSIIAFEIGEVTQLSIPKEFQIGMSCNNNHPALPLALLISFHDGYHG
jgi:hypothetical protein